MKFPPVKTPYTRFQGGLDLESPSLDIYPGALIVGTNYVCGTEGGYERIDGYERYSGQPKPSDATYYYCPCSFTGVGPSVGDTITGVDSGSTAEVIVVGSDYINVTKRSAALNADEVYNVGGSPKGTFTAAQAEKGETTAALHAAALNLAADVYRADISAPTGSNAAGKGGVQMLNGILYAFLDNAGATAGLIYKESASGWTAVTPGNEISFTTGTAEISDGDTVTQLVSGASATANRVVLESGTWAGGDAAGRLILGTITGTFDATNILQVGAANKATASSLATAITISPGGRYEFDVYNFTGSTATLRIYGCDGVNRGFEFDGTHYVPIDTGMTTDTPTHVKAFKQQLFFSFKGSSQNSGVGLPYQWTAVLGAAEIAVGDDITGYLVESETLLICSRSSTHQLSGDNVDTFFLDPLDAKIGAVEHTLQNIVRAHCLDDRGIIQIQRAQEYGNFNLGTVSLKIQKRINNMRAVAIASSVYRSKNQYRLYGSDGTGICITVGMGRYGLEYYPTQFIYPDNVACAVSGEDATGKDVVFFMDDAGMVYQADKGSSFDGDDIEAFMALPFDNSKSPSVLKKYRKALMEMSSKGYSELRFNATLDYGNTDIELHVQDDINVEGGGGYWDVAYWDEFQWDSQIVGNPSLTLEGDGPNISLSIYSKTDEDLGHTMEGVILHYTPLRIVR
tara:strand:- start:5284 stop:7332 length:2049 start_codon:yes stop_codon:yes gene_type:complete